MASSPLFIPFSFGLKAIILSTSYSSLASKFITAPVNASHPQLRCLTVTMASHFDPGDIQHFIEGLDGNNDSLAWGDIINFSQEDAMGYLVDDATSFITENQEPALTHGPTQASSHRPRSPSSDLLREDPGPYRHGFDATPHKEICENLSAPQVDFRGIGEAPEIYVEGQPPRPLDLTQEDDELHGSSLPTTRRRLGLPLVNASLSPSSISPGHSRPPSTDHSVSPVSAPSMSRDGSSRSGRKNPLSEPQRVKAADMRKARACHRCRMLKVEVRTPSFSQLLDILGLTLLPTTV